MRSIGFEGIRPVAPSRLADEVVDQIRQIILDRNLAEGTRLPSERLLAQQLQASRPIVSQALRTLSMMGLVEIKPGSGAYVLRRPQNLIGESMRLLLNSTNGSLEQLLELRLILERNGCRLAVERADAEQHAQIKAAFDRMSGAASSSEWVTADAVFHSETVRASGNPNLALMFEAVHHATVSNTYHEWIQSGNAPDWLRTGPSEHQTELHRDLLRALLDRDATSVDRAVLNHHRAMLVHLGIEDYGQISVGLI
jgi:GntR family transcriptional repressor for pyruvate dehydrogenase complex